MHWVSWDKYVFKSGFASILTEKGQLKHMGNLLDVLSVWPWKFLGVSGCTNKLSRSYPQDDQRVSKCICNRLPTSVNSLLVRTAGRTSKTSNKLPICFWKASNILQACQAAIFLACHLITWRVRWFRCTCISCLIPVIRNFKKKGFPWKNKRFGPLGTSKKYVMDITNLLNVLKSPRTLYKWASSIAGVTDAVELCLYPDVVILCTWVSDAQCYARIVRRTDGCWEICEYHMLYSCTAGHAGMPGPQEEYQPFSGPSPSFCHKMVFLHHFPALIVHMPAGWGFHSWRKERCSLAKLVHSQDIPKFLHCFRTRTAVKRHTLSAKLCLMLCFGTQH